MKNVIIFATLVLSMASCVRPNPRQPVENIAASLPIEEKLRIKETQDYLIVFTFEGRRYTIIKSPGGITEVLHIEEVAQASVTAKGWGNQDILNKILKKEEI